MGTLDCRRLKDHWRLKNTKMNSGTVGIAVYNGLIYFTEYSGNKISMIPTLVVQMITPLNGANLTSSPVKLVAKYLLISAIPN